MNEPITLIALDWGSTHVRAFAMNAHGDVIAKKQSSNGAMTLPDAGAFDRALAKLVGGWLQSNPHAGLIASGMVGAKTGWCEAPYVDVGSSLSQLAARAIRVNTSLGTPLLIVPGVKSSEPDVMRGEETQIAGSDVVDGMMVLPGTHSKWVRVERGRVVQFATYFTGEMNALIRAHSAIGKAISDAADVNNQAAFERGIARAKNRRSEWLHDLFVFRAAVVTGADSAGDVSTEFSAWLLGCEFASALHVNAASERIHVIASEALMPWYDAAARAFGLDCQRLDGEVCAARGLWRIARAL
jgi:2-dehydro-3-deoxygalactonokinase